MRKVIIAVVVLVLIPVVASADIIGRIGLYTDQIGTNCMIEDSAPGVVEIYIVVDRIVSGISAIQFAAPVPGCWTGATWLADVWPWDLVIGDTQFRNPGGVAIWMSCHGQTVYIGKMLINAQGSAQPCCEYPIVKADDGHPEVPTPIVTDCQVPNAALHGIQPSSAVVNGDASCFCFLAIPVETATWGRVKSLYE